MARTWEKEHDDVIHEIAVQGHMIHWPHHAPPFNDGGRPSDSSIRVRMQKLGIYGKWKANK